MRKQPLITGQYYHIYNRGVDKRDIFTDKTDLFRFIESIKEFNNIERIVSLANLRKSKNSQIGVEALPEKNSLVDIVGYCLNPNHFHFILKQSSENGIAKFMQKLQSGYTSYFNLKYSRSGSLMQGKFKSQLINNENYFNKLLGYVNKNYLVHNIPDNKNNLVYSGDFEYENNKFSIISKNEGEKFLEVFNGINNFKKHCNEIVSIIREERGYKSLLEDEEMDIFINSMGYLSR